MSSMTIYKLQVSSLLGMVMEGLHLLVWLTSSKQEARWGQDNLSGAAAVSAVMDIHVPNSAARQGAHGVWVSAR